MIARSTTATRPADSAERERFLLELRLPDTPAPAVDDKAIATQWARAHRWRYPTWTVVCRALDRCRERRGTETTPVPAIAVRPDVETPPPTAGRFGRRGASMMSLLLHAALLAAMAWCSGVQPRHDAEYTLVLVVPAAAEDLRPILGPVVFRPEEVPAGSAAGATPRPPWDAGAFAGTRSETAPDLPDLAGSRGVREPRPDIPFDPHPLPPAIEFPRRRPEPSPVEFFGVRAAGSRFVFVVDSSRSMLGRRWQAAADELTATIERLGPTRFFYVVLFDSERHPMFADAAPEPKMLPATPDNVHRLRRWLAGARLGFQTRPSTAVELALSFQPDAVFLLSDGEFEDATTVLLREWNLIRGREPRVLVHTIGLHSRQGQETLRRIAAEHGGTFKFVPETPAAAPAADRWLEVLER